MVLLSALLGACTVGEVPGSPDTGGGGSADRAVCETKVTPALPAHQHAALGADPAGARSGLGCVAAGCHLTGSLGVGASAMAFAGTVYAESAGNTPLGGVTIRMFPMGGDTSVAKAVTDDAGNFAIRGNFTAFPYETHVTGCGSTPDIFPMSGLIASPIEANCGAGGTCHGKPGGATPVYLP